MVVVPAWIGSLLISLMIGFIIGALLRHFLKFGVLALILVVVLLSLGYASPSAFQEVLNLINPEIKQIWADSLVTSVSGMASSIVFFFGLGLAVWKA